MFILMLACTENELTNVEKEVPEPLDTGSPIVLSPGIEVTPDAIDLGVLCDEGTTEVTLTSTGDGDLEVTGLSVTGAWSTGAYTLPIVLGPAESTTLGLTGTGAGELTVESNAGDVVVPLSASLEPPPALEWVWPLMDDILPMGQGSEFIVSAIEADEVTWFSDVDGELGTEAVTGNEARYLWNPSVQTPGFHTLTAIGSDACDYDTEEIRVCQQEGYTEGDIDLANWVATGTAFWDTNNNRLQLTANSTNQAGTAFQTQQSIQADSVDIQFSFYAGNHDGADGLSLTAIDIGRMTTYVGQSGGGIGYMGLPGWSLEFDTYCNGWDTTCNDHVSFHTDGDVYSPQHTTTIPDIEDNAWHDARVVMDGNLLTVELDGAVVLNAVTVTGATNFSGYVGFTGATGSLTNQQLVDELVVTNYACEE